MYSPYNTEFRSIRTIDEIDIFEVHRYLKKLRAQVKRQNKSLKS